MQEQSERVEVIVIGGGQAGLSVGYYLARAGRSFRILEANRRIGDSWRNRWDSLRLFTPARYDGLVGMSFPAPPRSFPTKDEMADYLEAYASRFNLPVLNGVKVTRVSRSGHRYCVETSDRTYETDHVVVAMASYQVPRVPAFASELDPDIVQIHSSAYRSPRQLRRGDVLIVGAGNSGSEIGIELARQGCHVLLSGRDTGHVPFRIDGMAARLLLPFLFRVVFHRILTVKTPLGRKARPKVISQGGPLIRVKPMDLATAGVERVPRVARVRGGRPVLDDGRELTPANVIWCTGFHPGFSWLDLPIFETDGEPRHESGIVTSEPGLYFVGLHFLHAFSSTMIHGIERDAKRITAAIDARLRAAGSTSAAVRSVPARAASL